jgi:hypothetical protein
VRPPDAGVTDPELLKDLLLAYSSSSEEPDVGVPFGDIERADPRVTSREVLTKASHVDGIKNWHDRVFCSLAT